MPRGTTVATRRLTIVTHRGVRCRTIWKMPRVMLMRVMKPAMAKLRLETLARREPEPKAKAV